MATVYLSADLRHDRNVAMKVLKPDLAQMLGHERFPTESGGARSADDWRPLGVRCMLPGAPLPPSSGS